MKKKIEIKRKNTLKKPIKNPPGKHIAAIIRHGEVVHLTAYAPNNNLGIGTNTPCFYLDVKKTRKRKRQVKKKKKNKTFKKRRK
jgi:hypothetical protein